MTSDGCSNPATRDQGRDQALIGIVGGGQLGRMLALAGIPLGFRFRFLEPNADPPVTDLGEVVQGAYDDAESLRRFEAGLDLITYEFERVPEFVARHLASAAPVLPPAAALAVAQDRLREKDLFRRLDIATVPYRAVDSREGLDVALGELGLPAVLKTRHEGYDGKGQRLLKDSEDVDRAWADLGGRPLILEGFSRFDRELSVVAVRGRDGDRKFYPLARNEHRDGILRVSRAPVADLPTAVRDEAHRIAVRILSELEYVGVLAVELFDTSEGLLANELAPRVHNSGHWTQDGAVTSQFENHVRAISGLPLGSADARGWSAMVNLIGECPDRARLMGVPDAHLHLYGKSPRPGRKIGHVNVVAEDRDEVEKRLGQLREIVAGGANRDESRG